MGIRDFYYSAEDKWYAFWEKTPLVGVVDAIDSVVPSLIIFILLLIVLAAFILFFSLSQNQVFDAKFTILTSDGRAVYDSMISASLMENGVKVKDISTRTDTSGEIIFTGLKLGQVVAFDINLTKGTYSGNYDVTGALDEQIRLTATPVRLSAVTKKIFIKMLSGLSPNEPIELELYCENSSLLPTPFKATYN